MKSYPLVALLFALCFGFVGCSNEPVQTPPPRPFVGILTVDKIGTAPRETAQYEVVVAYDHLEADKYEIVIGFGYIPSEEEKKAVGSPSEGIYAPAYREVVHNGSGQLRLTIDPSAVKKLGAPMDGKIYAIVSKYPHGKEWHVAAHYAYSLSSE